MSFTSGFINEGARLCHPVMLQVPPVTAHRVATHRADVVVSSQHGAGKTLQNNTESSGRHVEVARLEPHAIRVRNPAEAVLQVDVGNKVFAASAIRIEAVGETAKGGYSQ